MTLSDKSGAPSVALTVMADHVLQLMGYQSGGASSIFVTAAFLPSLITAAAPVGNTGEELTERMELLLCHQRQGADVSGAGDNGSTLTAFGLVLSYSLSGLMFKLPLDLILTSLASLYT